MKNYIGTKFIKAEPMTYGDFSIKKYGKLSENGAIAKEANGYLVEYENNYISWSPKFVFEDAYKSDCNLSFGQAIELMKKGNKVAREGWNGKGMFIVIMPELYLPPFNTQDTNRKVNDRTAKWLGEDKPLDSQAYIAMYNAQGKWQPGWLASQPDMLSNDWIIVE